MSFFKIVLYNAFYFKIIETASIMPLRSNPFLASIQELIPGQKRIIEDRQFEGIRTMPMYIMMFLSMASPILHDSYLLAWYMLVNFTLKASRYTNMTSVTSSVLLDSWLLSF